MIPSKDQPICETDEDGDKRWTLNGLLHREDGPALEYTNGSTLWYHHGALHRLDGPAEEWVNGYKYWWYQGERISCSSQEEFERIIKLKFLF